jgi:hypothetical protein
VTTFEKTAQTVKKTHQKQNPPKLKTQFKCDEAFNEKQTQKNGDFFFPPK